MSEDRSRDFSIYDEMETEQLEEILRADADAPEGAETDMDMILYIMQVLTERRKQNGGTKKTALEAYRSFEENYMPEEFKRKTAAQSRRWVRVLTTAAAAVVALVIFGGLTAEAFGFNFWNAIATWTKETFQFVGEQTDEREAELSDISPMYSLRTAMVESNDAPIALPSIVPDGFELVDLMVEDMPRQRSYTAFYKDEDRSLRIVALSYIDSRPEQLEQSEDISEIYEMSGTLYYIFSNNAQMQAVWINDTYECHISGDVTIEELKMMIDSIEKG